MAFWRHFSEKTVKGMVNVLYAIAALRICFRPCAVCTYWVACPSLRMTCQKHHFDHFYLFHAFMHFVPASLRSFCFTISVLFCVHFAAYGLLQLDIMLGLYHPASDSCISWTVLLSHPFFQYTSTGSLAIPVRCSVLAHS